MSDVFRKNYKELSEIQIEAIRVIKELAQHLLDVFDLSEANESCKTDKRCMALARTNLEQAVMWAVKAIT